MGIESLSALLSDGLVAAGVNEMLRSLLVDGIVAGVGGILTFCQTFLSCSWHWHSWRTADTWPVSPMSWRVL